MMDVLCLDGITKFWRHNELSDVMTCFDFMTNFLTSWRIFDFMTNGWHIFVARPDLDVMKNFRTSWRTCSRHDKDLTLFNVNDELCEVITNLLSSLTCFWHLYELFDIMTCLSHHDSFLILQTFRRQDVCCTYWRHGTFWWHETLVDVMTQCSTSDELFMLWCVFFTSWRTLCCHDVFLTTWPAFCCFDIFCLIILWIKYNENVILML